MREDSLGSSRFSEIQVMEVEDPLEHADPQIHYKSGEESK